MSKLGEGLTEDQRADVATIMRQSQCYDVHRVVDVYKANNFDVIESICTLMDIPSQTAENNEASESPFTEIREIMKEKYEIYYKRQQQS